MRRVFAVLTLCALLLCGCAKEEDVLAPAIEFRAALLQAGGCSFRAKIEADFGDCVERFAVDCEFTTDGTAKLTLTEPETIAGITATVTERGGRITYDGMSVDFGLLANGNVKPAAAPALTALSWSGEYIAAAGWEDDVYRVTYEKDFDEKRLQIDTYYKNDLPFLAEVCYNNQRILKLEISDFSLH
ncbi:MAG: hypothetical protein IJJ99_01390 [Oscillospiraceae bacterium]|nr:hypothetical protein [Oscillospiraceae bacterium]